MHTHPSDLLALEAPAGGLILTPCPGTKDVDTETALKQLKAAGASAVITLMQDSEMASNAVTELPDALRAKRAAMVSPADRGRARARRGFCHRLAGAARRRPSIARRRQANCRALQGWLRPDGPDGGANPRRTWLRQRGRAGGGQGAAAQGAQPCRPSGLSGAPSCRCLSAFAGAKSRYVLSARTSVRAAR
jgi:hypothetical protein